MNRFLEMDQNDDASRNLEMGITMITNFVLKKMLINIVFIIMSSKGFVLLQMSDFATLREREREREREKVLHLVKKHPLVKSGGEQKLNQKDIILIIIMNR
jgi:hypothetical protein